MRTLYHRGRIYNPAEPRATAMLVDGERIAWVGLDAEWHNLAADAVVDLRGALVTPAFVDAHVHLTETGLARDSLDLTEVTSRTDVLERVAARAGERPGEVVMGFGWEEDGWPDRHAPDRDDLDRASGGAAVYLARRDVHTAVISSAVVAADPSIAAADGYYDGVVRRDAHHLARQAARAAIDPARLPELRREALRHAASLGVGAVHEMGAPQISTADDFVAVLALGADPTLPDVLGYWGELDVQRARELGALGAGGDLNIDGSLGSRSARLSVPYADAPGERGRLYTRLDTATAHVVACTRAGVQAGFHCIGDEAVETAVAAVATAADQCGLAEVVACRHRLEHVEMLTPRLVAELARLGVAASVQPAFDQLWGGPSGMYADRLGRARAASLNPLADLATAGVGLAFGSDSPVTPLAGWATVRAAVWHQTPEQRLSPHEAFTAATLGGWRAARVHDAGVLAPGMVASFAVWDVPGDGSFPDLGLGAAMPECRQTVVRGGPVWSGMQPDTPATSPRFEINFRPPAIL